MDAANISNLAQIVYGVSVETLIFSSQPRMAFFVAEFARDLMNGVIRMELDQAPIHHSEKRTKTRVSTKNE